MVEGNDNVAARFDELGVSPRGDVTHARQDGREAPREVLLEHAISRRGQSCRDEHLVGRAGAQVARNKAIERGVEPLALAGERRVELEHRRAGALLQYRERSNRAVELHHDLGVQGHVPVVGSGDDVLHLELAFDGEGMLVVLVEAGGRAVDDHTVAPTPVPAGELRLEQ